MLALSRAIVVLAIALLAPVAAQAASLAQQVKAAYASYDAAFNSGKPNAVAALYTENAVLLPTSHDVLKGRAAIAKFDAGLFKAGIHSHKLELIEANGNGDIIVAAARWSATAKDGSTIGGVAVHEFVRRPNGSLKLRLHTFN